VSPSRTTVALAVLAVAALVGGALYFGVSVEDGPPDPDALRDRVSERNASLDTYAATVDVTIERGNDTVEGEYRLALDRPNRTNLTYRGPDRVDGDVVIANGSGVFAYDASREEWGVYAERARQSYDVLATLVGVVTRGNGTYEGTDRVEGSSGVVLRYSAGGEDVGLRVGGSAPASRFTSLNGSDRVGVSVWVDPQRDLPTRIRQRYRSGDGNVTVTVRLTAFRANPAFGGDQFRYAPPPGADRVDRRNVTRTYDSRAALAANASLSVPDPAVPANFSLSGAASARLDGNRSVSLVYRDGPATVVVLKRTPPSPVAENGTALDLGPVEGRYVTTARGAAVVWNCDGATYSVSGTVDRELLVSVARSVACE
jgi:outer membrane lipoprotein-sorting protein